MRWLFSLDQEFQSIEEIESCFSEDELERIAAGYWSGEAMPDSIPVFEFRSNYAIVRLCVENNFEEKFSESNSMGF